LVTEDPVPHLFDEIKFRGVSLRNRIGVSPMCQYSSENGHINDWHLVHLGSRAVGGAGLVIMEATAVEARGRITPADAGIWSDAHIEPLSRLTRFLSSQGAVPGIQIAHAGRKSGRARPWDGDRAVDGWDVIGPSPLAFDTNFALPKEMTTEDIRAVIASFRDGARRANEAGFQWLEIHGAHGYLIHSFFSPLSNQRKDLYGGNFNHRIRFLLEVTAAVRAEWPEDKPLSVRLSCSDWTEGGWTIEDTIELSRMLKREGIDLIDCSSGGGVMGAKIPVGAGYQVPFAEAIRKHAEIPTAAVGMITDPMQADETIRNGRADLVFLARELLRDPYWPLRAAGELHQSKRAPVPTQYLRAF